MLKLAIDFGTSVTKIYKLGSGIVLAESTCVSVESGTGELRAFGNDARRLYGKTGEGTDVMFPVWEGEICNETYAAALLEYFLNKITGRVTSVEALFCVPCGCSAASREKYYRVARMAGISRIRFAESTYLAALGHDVPLSESNPVFALDIGAGKTSLSVFSLDGTIAGLTMNVGGNNMDVHIIDHLAETRSIKIGVPTSEKLKNTVGSLLDYDNQSMPANGRDIATGRPATVTVSSADVLIPIRSYVDKILDYAEIVLRKLPAEVSAAMCKNGVFLAGGVASLTGLADYVAERLQMEAHLPADAQMAVVLGGGRAIGNRAVMNKICLE